MSHSAVYEATRVPRYGSMTDQSEIIGNIVAQRAFLSTVISSLCFRNRGSLELRFISENSGRVRIFATIFFGESSRVVQESDPALRLVERLLPHEYKWTRSSSGAIDGDLAGRRVRVARIVRALEFIDLPPASVTAVGNLVTDSSDPNALRGLLGQPAASRSSVTPDPGAFSRSLRELPSLNSNLYDLATRRLCLPFLGALEDWRAEASVFFEELVASRPAIVSIHLRPTQLGELANTMPIAAMWRIFLKQVLPDLGNVGLADAQSLIRTFDRYSLPANLLAQASIRCAARSDGNAWSVASVLATCLGGARRFRVIPPAIDVQTSVLRELGADYPLPGLPQSDVNEFLKVPRKEVADAGIEAPEDDEALDLLARAPHLYSIEELQVLAQLPLSGEDGLPGVETEMIPPFYGGVPRNLESATAANSASASEAFPASNGPTTTSSQTESRIRIRGAKPQHKEGQGAAAKLIRIGCRIERKNMASEESESWHEIPLNDLSKHALIVGSTGSGKTLTTLFLTRELLRNQLPVLIIEPVKTEYYRLLQKISGVNVKRMRFEGDADGQPVADFLAFDPMRLRKGVTIARHASYLKACFLSAFPLDPVLALMLEAGLREYYTSPVSSLGCGFAGSFRRGDEQTTFEHEYDVKRGGKPVIDADGRPSKIRAIHPSLESFIQFFLGTFLPKVVSAERVGANSPSASRLAEWQQIFRRRFDAIRSGPIGLAARKEDELFRRYGPSYDPLGPFFGSEPTHAVIELDGIPDDEQKSLMMAFILTFLFERRQADDFAERERNERQEPQHLRHVLIVEEAHRVFSNPGRGRSGEVAGLDAKAKAVALFVDMLAEVRALGQGIIIVEQIPTKIVTEAIKNTNLKIMLRLTSRDDRDYLGEAMNFTENQKRFVTNLRVSEREGISMVVFEEGLDQPALLRLPVPQRSAGTAIYDELF